MWVGLYVRACVVAIGFVLLVCVCVCVCVCDTAMITRNDERSDEELPPTLTPVPSERARKEVDQQDWRRGISVGRTGGIGIRPTHLIVPITSTCPPLSLLVRTAAHGPWISLLLLTHYFVY